MEAVGSRRPCQRVAGQRLTSYTRPCENIGAERTICGERVARVRFAIPAQLAEIGVSRMLDRIVTASHDKKAAMASTSPGTPRIAITRFML
jgi:hypothetical protein